MLASGLHSSKSAINNRAGQEREDINLRYAEKLLEEGCATVRQFREVELAYLREPCGFKKGHLRLVEAHRKKVR